MSKRPSLDPIESVVAEAPSVAAPAKKVAASLQMLDGDEIIQLSIRPSPWCIPLYSFKLLLAMLLLAAAVAIAAQGQPWLPVSIALTVIVLVAFSGVVAATLQWASQLYVLTNRRVLRFQGVFSVSAAECALAKISEARLRSAWYQPMLRLGSIHMTPTSRDKPDMIWAHVARPAEVHEILVRAIRKAKAG